MAAGVKNERGADTDAFPTIDVRVKKESDPPGDLALQLQNAKE
jgi:hypothetical protein